MLSQSLSLLSNARQKTSAQEDGTADHSDTVDLTAHSDVIATQKLCPVATGVGCMFSKFVPAEVAAPSIEGRLAPQTRASDRQTLHNIALAPCCR